MAPGSPTRGAGGSRRLLFGSLVVVAVLVVAGMVGFMNRVEQARDELAADVERCTAALRARPATREVLWGEPVPGDGMVHYREAIRLAKRQRIEQRWADWVAAARRGNGAEAAERAAAMVTDGGRAIAALQRGARCAAVRPTASYERGFEVRLLNLLELRAVANLALLTARTELRAGEPVAAARRLLDAAAFGVDVRRSGLVIEQMIGLTTVAIAVWEPFEPAFPVAGDLRGLLDDAGARRVLSAGLERLDRRLAFDPVEASGETAAVGHGLLRAVRDAASPQFLESRWEAWRFGFSTALVAADAFESLVERDAVVAAAAAMDWPGRKRELARQAAATASSSNPFLAKGGDVLPMIDKTATLVRAQVRVVRALVHFAETGEVPELADPFAPGRAALRSERDAAGGVTIWSVGPDGLGRKASRPVQLHLAGEAERPAPDGR